MLFSKSVQQSFSGALIELQPQIECFTNRGVVLIDKLSIM